MRKKILKDTSCEACGSWEFECRDDGEYYCNSCSLPFVQKTKKPENKKRSASPDKMDAVGK